MVGNRPVDSTGFHRVHGFVPNCTAEGLRNVFCMEPDSSEKYFTLLDSKTTTIIPPVKMAHPRDRIVHSYAKPAVLSNCDRYFERVLQKDPSAIRMKVLYFAKNFNSFSS